MIYQTTKFFQEYLKTNRLKLTSQRKLILDVFASSTHQMTAEELHAEVSNIDPGISLSTVYRTLKHLLQSGLGRCVHFGDGTTRFEFSDGQNCYMICETCGRKIPVTNPYVDCIFEENARQEGFRMFRSQSTIYGICHQCLNAREMQVQEKKEKEFT